MKKWILKLMTWWCGLPEIDEAHYHRVAKTQAQALMYLLVAFEIDFNQACCHINDHAEMIYKDGNREAWLFRDGSVIYVDHINLKLELV